ncbi:hypothetical protein M2454_001905 [Aequitasia blattaphilus]|uniref:Minor capsid protein n=1 Tax=Aequitasia blattaphilus TaxID=2949332 RepID=A0ABT1E9U2_9FIRM|nr:minor capsid protein [Aequitasia blattaphilus]MCP1102593.1 minor capsid protein [Aequitasia blattaphilus]MCR8615233.1 minor capsid protein [Aequitasia blattaphilus]
MDFMDKLVESINQIPNLPLPIRKGYLGPTECMVLYPLPGGQKAQTYMDGAKDIELNCEIAMKSKDAGKIDTCLWLVADFLETMETLESKQFEFNDLNITSKPFINDADEQGWFVFLLDFQANLTTGGKQ